ncbi:MAG: hypothetical protein QOJ91_1952 [Sphingomonadales bacterium]|jgi:hypothetical protein|nr:hypothetical protein [Sphingomonadales bacterium]
MRRSWTLVGLGATAEPIALALWAFVGAYEFLFWPFLALSILAGLAGAWIVLSTMFDLTFHRPRGERLRPLRSFDFVLGSGLFVLALLQLRDALGVVSV